MRGIWIWGLMSVVAAGLGHAAIYKWVDAQGKVQYSDQPPNLDAKGKPLKVQVPQGAEEVSRKAVDESNAKATKDADDRKKADALAIECKLARSNVKVLQSAGKVFKEEKDGRVEMSPEERQKELASTTEFIKSCPP